MNDWKQTLRNARKEHGELIQQRDVLDAQQAELDIEREKLETKILQLQKTIHSLSELVGESHFETAMSRASLLGGAYDNLKLAEAVRKVLQSADQYWTPINVRDALVAQRYGLSGYTNALASIHAVLKRIYESGEALRMAGGDSKAMYRWKPPLPSEPQFSVANSERTKKRD
jgi:chromosome segregation ATPase